MDQGSISGTVKDTSGGSIAGAQVTLTNQDTGVTQSMTTNALGEYIFAPIKIGTYSLTAEFKGFQKVQQKNVSVDVQQKLLVDITLPAGASSETVIVNEAPPALQTQDASVGQVIEEREVKSLPLNGRNFTFLAQLSAGVTQDQADTRGLGDSGSFAAERPASRAEQLFARRFGQQREPRRLFERHGVCGAAAGRCDSEFKVETNDYSAEMGRSAGAVLNATIKSGSNQYPRQRVGISAQR